MEWLRSSPRYRYPRRRRSIKVEVLLTKIPQSPIVSCFQIGEICREDPERLYQGLERIHAPCPLRLALPWHWPQNFVGNEPVVCALTRLPESHRDRREGTSLGRHEVERSFSDHRPEGIGRRIHCTRMS